MLVGSVQRGHLVEVLVKAMVMVRLRESIPLGFGI
jgi:hypothetical protein